jgi:hypothetical protein
VAAHQQIHSFAFKPTGLINKAAHNSSSKIVVPLTQIGKQIDPSRRELSFSRPPPLSQTKLQKKGNFKENGSNLAKREPEIITKSTPRDQTSITSVFCRKGEQSRMKQVSEKTPLTTSATDSVVIPLRQVQNANHERSVNATEHKTKEERSVLPSKTPPKKASEKKLVDFPEELDDYKRWIEAQVAIIKHKGGKFRR